jgi:CubicO group peptidase (beta-lactamase class C family)
MSVLDGLFTRADLGTTLAAMVVDRGGSVVEERYGDGVEADTKLISWSTAKSITHALVGTLVDDGLVALDDDALFPQWADDARRTITVQHLLTMTDGLDFNEEYVDAGESHVIDMLFFAGKDDVSEYACGRPLRYEPGAVWNYSSGTTNVLCALARDRAGDVAERLRTRVFGPAGMDDAVATFDAAGTFVGSSFVHAPTRDFARFGAWYLRGGDGALPEGWTQHAATATRCVPVTEAFGYGAHWWLWRDPVDPPGTFGAHGFEGQRIVVLPALDRVVVRLGKTDAELVPNLNAELRNVIAALG